jgi:uncharacterized protein (DUF342 family)
LASPDRIRVSLGRDNLLASVQVFVGPNDAAVSESDIRSALIDAGVNFGIDEEAVRSATMAPSGQKVVVARGEAPREGVDAIIHYRETPGKPGAPKKLEDGRVDYRDLQMVRNVVKGQVLAEKEPAMPGLPGRDVRGRPISPPSVKDAAFPQGRGTAVTPDGLNLVSLIDGHLTAEVDVSGRTKYHVDEVFVLRRSVDMSTGNLHCIGSCVIKGHVNEGFQIVARGDITICGDAEGSEFISHEGSVIFEKGLRGQNKARVSAKLDVVAKFIENAEVLAGRDIRLEEHALHSTLRSGRDLVCEGRPGALIGGNIFVLRKLSCHQLGSETNPRTFVYLGDWISSDARSELKRVHELLEEARAQAEGMRQALVEMRRLTLEDPESHRERIATLAKSAEAFPIIRERIARLEEEEKAVSEKIRPIETDPIVDVAGPLFTGVVFAGDELQDTPVRKDRRSVRIVLHGEGDRPGLTMKPIRG